MRPLRFLVTSALLLLAPAACHEPAITPTAEALAPRAGAGTRAEPKAAPKPAPARETEEAPPLYRLPLAWQDKHEPLALTRAYLKEAFQDNQRYMEHGTQFLSAADETALPRATVVTCADSRVQTQAWDAHRENDDYTVRNFGNQIVNDEGSIEYGVEQLGTPLLLIIGHTGCGAVKAATADTSKLSKSLQVELRGMKLPRPIAGRSANQLWADAVVANVHNQVGASLRKFAKRVESGTLTVVGAVYDLRDDLGRGPGKLVIIDVNGNRDEKPLADFVSAVEGGASDGHTLTFANGRTP